MLERQIGQPFRLSAAPPLQIFKAFMGELPTFALSFDVVALKMKLLVLTTKIED